VSIGLEGRYLLPRGEFPVIGMTKIALFVYDADFTAVNLM